MNYKRAIGIGVVVYFMTMVLGVLACAILGITPSISEPIPTEMWIFTSFVAVLLSIGGAFRYFAGKGIAASMNAGLRFGAVLIAVGFLLDVLFFASLSFEGHDPVAVMMSYYSQPYFWLTLVLILVGTAKVGHMLEAQRKH